MLTLQTAPPTLPAATLSEVVALVNRAYAAAEAGLFLCDAPRTDLAETSASAAAGALTLAWEDGRPVGAITHRLLDPHTGWFGALAVAQDRDGRGIGAQLVRSAEEWAIAQGAREMVLEILVPEPTLPHFERLAAWYGRLGYREVRRASLATLDPASAAQLARPCAVETRRKALSDAARGPARPTANR